MAKRRAKAVRDVRPDAVDFRDLLFRPNVAPPPQLFPKKELHAVHAVLDGAPLRRVSRLLGQGVEPARGAEGLAQARRVRRCALDHRHRHAAGAEAGERLLVAAHRHDGVAAHSRGFARQRFTDAGYRRPLVDEVLRARLSAATRQVLGDADFERAEVAGRALDLDAAMLELRQWLARGAAP